MNKIRVLKLLSTGLVLVAMVFAFLVAGIRIFGVQVYGVLTGSMEPSYPTGSLIYVKRVDASELRVNDVITFSISPNVIATHRIVEIVPDEANPAIVRFRTKGDANDEVDASLVSASNVIGKAMFAIPQMGYIASYIQQPPGIYVAILVCGLLIAFVFYTDSLENKKKASFQRGDRRGHSSQQRPRSQQREYDRPREYSREDYPRQREYSREDYSRQREYSREDYPRQREYAREDYPRQREYAREDYPRQREYSREDYPRQREYSREDYPRQREYSREDYPRQQTRESEFARQFEYPRQRTYRQSAEESRSEYSNSRDSRSGRR